jgi:hypothetical protein
LGRCKRESQADSNFYERERKAGDRIGEPRHGLERDLRKATLCCYEPRDDTGDHNENRALGH